MKNSQLKVAVGTAWVSEKQSRVRKVVAINDDGDLLSGDIVGLIVDNWIA